MTGRSDSDTTRGDVVEVNLSGRRVAYLQDCGRREHRLARFLPGIHASRLADEELGALVAGPSLYRATCSFVSLLLDGEASVIANLPIPVGEDVFPDMVSQKLSNDWRRWWVTTSDGAHVKAPDYVLAHPDTDLNKLLLVNDRPVPRVLRLRIEAGWTPDNPVAIQDDAPPQSERLPRPITQPRTMYLSSFDAQETATEYAKRMAQHGFDIEVADRAIYDRWSVEASNDGYFDEKIEAIAATNTEELGGIYDGEEDIST